MKNAKISRRSFLKAGAVASAVGMLSAAPVAAHAAETDASAAADEENGLLDVFKKPKYVFLFIGDGMGTAQIQSARFYKGTVDNNGAVTEADLSFTSFPQVGSVTTYDSTSFCPDSASTATSIATGHKTESGVINMCPWTRDVPYETIAEKLHAQKGLHAYGPSANRPRAVRYSFRNTYCDFARFLTIVSERWCRIVR